MPPIPAKPEALHTPQARVLCALMPDDISSHWVDWPLLNRVDLASRAGFTPTTGTINRVLNGIPEGSSSGKPHKGLLDRKLIKAIPLNHDGITENNYRITEAGIKAYQRHIIQHGELPPQRKKESCVNDRYQPSTTDE